MNPPNQAISGATFSAPRLPGWLATWSGLWGITWRSVWAGRRLPVLVILALASPLLAWLGLRTSSLDLRPDWINWITSVHFGLVIPLWCLIAFGSFIRDEIQAGTMGFLLTRPLTRSRLLLLRWVCTLLAAQVPLAVSTSGLGLIALFLGIPQALSLTPLLLAAQCVVIFAYGAIAALIGLITRKYLLLGLVYGFVVEIGIGQIPTNINTLSVARHSRTLLDQFNAMALNKPALPAEIAWAIGMLLVLTLAYLIAATVLFNIREYNQSEENK